MAGQPWTNQDGLIVRYGQQKTVNQAAGEYLSYGDWREISVDIPLAAVANYTYGTGFFNGSSIGTSAASAFANTPLYNTIGTGGIVGNTKSAATQTNPYQGNDQNFNGNVPINGVGGTSTTIIDMDTFFPLTTIQPTFSPSSLTGVANPLFSANGIFLDTVEVVSLTGLQGYQGSATGINLSLVALNPNSTSGTATNPQYQFISTLVGGTGTSGTGLATRVDIINALTNQYFAVPGTKVLVSGVGQNQPQQANQYVAASGSWASGASTLPISSAANAWITGGMAIYDTTSGGSATGQLIGYAGTFGGATSLSLADASGTTIYASVGSTDTLVFSNGSWMGVIPTVTNSFTSNNQIFVPNKAWLCLNTLGGNYGAGSTANWGGNNSTVTGLASGYTSQGLIRVRIKYFMFGQGTDPTVGGVAGSITQ